MDPPAAAAENQTINYQSIMMNYQDSPPAADSPSLEEPRIRYISVIPERRIASIKYAPQEHTNPNPDKRGIRVDVEAANIATFTPEDKVKYEFNMTTDRDIRNQIRYAERKGMEKEAERVARRMLADKMPVEIIAKYSGLSEEQVRAL